MLPRALLFSSDERTARVLIEILTQLRIEVEHCREIFAAVERLTSRTFDALIADWSEDLEASFFLKTARELKSSKSTFALAIVQEKDMAAAFQVGVNGVLTKPVTAEQAKNTLLAARNLIYSARNISEPPSPVERVRESALPVEDTSNADTPSENPISARDAEAFRDRLPAASSPGQSPALSFAGYAQTTRVRPGPKGSIKKGWLGIAFLVLLGTALSISWKLGYVPDSMQSKAIAGLVRTRVTAVSISKRIVRRQTAVPIAPASHEPGVLSQAQFVDSVFSHFDPAPAVSSTQIRVGPVLPLSQQTKTKPPESLPQLSNLATLVEHDQTSVARSGENPDIPYSLTIPVQAMIARTISAVAPLATRWTPDPISIPENTSRALLIHQVAPSYPESAVQAGLEGRVILQVLVGRDGAVHDLKVLEGYLVLGRAAFDAVKQWRYKPYRLNGEVVEMQTLITVNFRYPETEGGNAEAASSRTLFP